MTWDRRDMWKQQLNARVREMFANNLAARVEFHLQGQHDQESHGNWAEGSDGDFGDEDGGASSGWGSAARKGLNPKARTAAEKAMDAERAEEERRRKYVAEQAKAKAETDRKAREEQARAESRQRKLDQPESVITGREFEDRFIQKLADDEVEKALAAKEAELLNRPQSHTMEESVVPGKYVVKNAKGERVTDPISYDQAQSMVDSIDAKEQKKILDDVEKDVRERDEFKRGIFERAGLKAGEAADLGAIKKKIAGDDTVKEHLNKIKPLSENLEQIDDYIGGTSGLSSEDIEKIKSGVSVAGKIAGTLETAGDIANFAHFFGYLSSWGVRLGIGLSGNPLTLVGGLAASYGFRKMRKAVEKAIQDKANAVKAVESAINRRIDETSSVRNRLTGELEREVRGLEARSTAIAREHRIADYKPSSDAIKAYMNRENRGGRRITKAQATEELTDAYRWILENPS